MKPATIFFACLVAIGGQFRTVDAQVTLEQKLPENTTYTSVVETQMIQTLTLNEMDIDTNVSQTMTIENQSGERGADGQLRIDHKVTGLRTQMTIPNLGEISFDSTKPDEATDNVLTPILKATANSAWHTIYDKNNAVVAVKGRDESLEGIDENLKNFVKGQLDSDYLTEAAKIEMSRIPGEPVAVDESWELTHALRVDSSQVLTFDKKYTYRGQEEFNGKMLDRIDVEATGIKFEILPNSPLPLKVTKSDLEIGETSGKLYFDREQGRVVFDEQMHQVKGEFTLDANGTELPSKLDLRMITRMRDE